MKIYFKEENHLLRQIITNYGWYLLSYLVIFLTSLTKIPVLTRLLTPADLGVLAFYTSILSYIQALFFSWVSSTIWRFIHDKNVIKNNSQLLHQLFLPVLLSILLSGGLLFFLSVFIHISAAGKIILFTGFFMIISQEIISWYLIYLQAKESIKAWGFITGAQTILSFTVMLFLLIILKWGVISIYLGPLVINALLLTGITYVLGKEKKFSFQSAVPLHLFYSYSLLTVIINCCVLILNNADRIIINYYKGSSALGIYSQTYSIASVGFYSIIQVFNSIFLPVYNKNLMGRREDIYQRIILLFIVLLFPGCLFFCFNSSYFSQLLLSKKFQGYSTIIPYVASGIFLFGLANFFEIQLKFENKIKIAVVLLLFTAVFNIILNLLLLKHYGIVMAAVTTLLSYLLLFTILIFYNKKNIQLFHKIPWKNLLTCCLLIAAFCRLTKMLAIPSAFLSLSLNLVFSLIIYFLFMKKHIGRNLAEIQ